MSDDDAAAAAQRLTLNLEAGMSKARRMKRAVEHGDYHAAEAVLHDWLDQWHSMSDDEQAQLALNALTMTAQLADQVRMLRGRMIATENRRG